MSKLKLLGQALVGACLFILFFAWQTSWFDSSASWQQTTGYADLPIEQRPSLQLLPLDQPQVFWLGHAGFIIKWGGINLLLDPNLSSNAAIVHRAHQPFLTASELPAIDAAIISHAHYDHLDLPTLEKVAQLETIIVPEGTQEFLSPSLLRRSRIVGLEIAESVQVKNLKITAVTAVHNGSRNHPFGSKHLAAGYIISNGSVSLYFAGDTGWGDHFAAIAQQYKPQIAILPIGGYEPYFILQNYHLNPTDAVRAAKVLGVDQVFPAHFGTFRVALEPLTFALRNFAAEADQQQLNWRMAPPYSRDGGTTVVE